MGTSTKQTSSAQWEEARRLLVEGRPVAVGTRVVRFFPSYREVARSLECYPSKVARWVQSEGLLDARRQQLAADRVAVVAAVPITTETLAEETLALVNASCASRRRRPGLKTVATVLRLITCVYGAAEARPGLLRELEQLRVWLLKGRAQ